VHDIDLSVASDSVAIHRSVFHGAPVGLLVLDQERRVVEANAAAIRALGHGESPIEGRSFLELFSEDSTERIGEAIEDGLACGGPVLGLWVTTVDGTPVTLDVMSVSAEHGPWLVAQVRHRDDAGETKRRLHDEKQRHHTLFMWAPVALREEDFSAVENWLDGLRLSGVTDLPAYMDEHPDEVRSAILSIKTTRVNHAAVRLLKAPDTQEIMRGFREAELTGPVVDSFKNQFVAIWNREDYYEAEFVGMNYEDEPFECRVNWAIPRIDGVLDLSRMVVALLDLTDLRATERRLRRLVDDKDRFIATVSHELRTPLASVLGVSEELSDRWDHFDRGEAQELVGLVAAQATDLAMLVEDLLVAAHLETSTITVRTEPVDLRAVCEAAIAECGRTDAGADGVVLAGEDQMALGDAPRVRQIVRNLVSNAVKYGGDHISVEPGYRSRPSVAVIDDGEGIPLEQRESVFDAYYRRDRDTQIVGSLGLGLAISRELARCMGGDLTYHYQDGRSVFLLDLPVLPSPEPAGEAG